MSKLIEELANLPAAEVEEMVGQYFAHQLLGIVSEDTPEKREGSIQKLHAIRGHVLVAALSDGGRKWVLDLCDTAERLVSMDDD